MRGGARGAPGGVRLPAWTWSPVWSAQYLCCVFLCLSLPSPRSCAQRGLVCMSSGGSQALRGPRPEPIPGPTLPAPGQRRRPRLPPHGEGGEWVLGLPRPPSGAPSPPLAVEQASLCPTRVALRWGDRGSTRSRPWALGGKGWSVQLACAGQHRGRGCPVGHAAHSRAPAAVGPRGAGLVSRCCLCLLREGSAGPQGACCCPGCRVGRPGPVLPPPTPPAAEASVPQCPSVLGAACAMPASKGPALALKQVRAGGQARGGAGAGPRAEDGACP